ncbi:MAG: PhzF family phenazine biosynthesis protein [Actinobacteria bacterium]|nr:PhzF family phenazine biosynthesis protein [Actinomycetota bacterium]
MDILYYHIDAFISGSFSGNPAGVCFLEEWPEDNILQSIAAENNLPETAFVVPADGFYELRWFSPTMEIDLCGHATLASAHAIFEYINRQARVVDFQTAGGPLSVERRDELLVMDFPSRPPEPCGAPLHLAEILGAQFLETLSARDLLVVFEEEAQVRDLAPDMAGIAALDAFAVCVTAPGRDCDFVSRFFAPGAGIDEDPVTGSAHCSLIPYWSARLSKTAMHARQLSKRGGELFCADNGERVSIGGLAATYLTGTISV